MISQFHIVLCTLSLVFTFTVVVAQQPYAGRGSIKCDSDNSSSNVGYFCNGQSPSCQAYLIFRSKLPYGSVASISKLLNSDLRQLSRINSVLETANFEADNEVVVPVNCSCSGDYYQATSYYVVKHGDTRYLIATNYYQGLVSCITVRYQSSYSKLLYTGMNITIPLRCACPTTNQTRRGFKYLFTYLVRQGETVLSISRRFGVDAQEIIDANELSENSVLSTSSTLVIPLKKMPVIPSSSPTMPPTMSPSQKRTRREWVYAVIGAAAAVSFAVVVFVFLMRRGKNYRTHDLKGRNSQSEMPSDELMVDLLDINNVKVIEFEKLRQATENFSEECKIAGSVYHGFVMGTEVAIKEVGRDVSKEVNILKSLNHFNLIRLLGVCSCGDCSYLVYEYAENGPLSSWIFDEIRSKVFGWVLRVQIAFDVATGLSYLHSYTEPAHVHMDITSSNILLDRGFRAKIANFGMARYSTAGEGQPTSTKNIVGSRGYMAPEFLNLGLISPKLDVYAFGVVMLEIISGKEAILSCGDGEMFLSEAFLALMRGENAEEKLNQFMDPSLNENFPSDLALRIARLIEVCLSNAAKSRPRMDDIMQSLSYILSASVAWELSNASISDTEISITSQ